MNLSLSSKSKLIFSVILGITLVLSGTLFALGKAGVINIRSFADEVVVKTQQLTGTKSASSTVNISTITDLTNNNNLKFTFSDGIKKYSGIMVTYPKVATFTQVPYGVYTLKFDNQSTFDLSAAIGPTAGCQAELKFEINATTNTVNVKMCTINREVACGNQTCSANQYCNTTTNTCEDKPAFTTMSLHGKVLDSSAAALSGVKISGNYSWNGISYETNGISQANWLTENFSPDTDSQANYKIGNIKDNLSSKITLTYELSGYVTATQDIYPNSLTNKRIPDIKLARANETIATIKGQLYRLDQNQNRIGLSGIINLKKSDGSFFNNVTTDTNGNYKRDLYASDLTGLGNTILVSGQYSIYDSTHSRAIITLTGNYNDGHGNRSGSLAVESGKIYNNIDVLIDFNNVPNDQTIISGQVLDKATNKPIEGAFVSLVQDGKYLEFAPGKTDADGKYNMVVTVSPAINPPLRYQIVASKQGYSDDAAARKSFSMVRGRSYLSPQTDFKLNKCN